MQIPDKEKVAKAIKECGIGKHTFADFAARMGSEPTPDLFSALHKYYRGMHFGGLRMGIESEGRKPTVIITDPSAEPPKLRPVTVCVGDLVYYRPMHESTLKSSPVIRIMPTLPEPLVCLEDGKMMGLSSVPYFLPAAAQN